MSRILIADDQNDVLEALRILLKGEGHQTDAVTSLAEALKRTDHLRAVRAHKSPRSWGTTSFLDHSRRSTPA